MAAQVTSSMPQPRHHHKVCRALDSKSLLSFNLTTLGDADTWPRKQAASTTSTLCPAATSDASPLRSATLATPPTPGTECSVPPDWMQGSNGETGAETSTATQRGARAAGTTRTSVTDGSLWDRAYDALKKDKDKIDRIAKYEGLLSRMLIKGWYPSCLAPLFSIASFYSEADKTQL